MGALGTNVLLVPPGGSTPAPHPRGSNPPRVPRPLHQVGDGGAPVLDLGDQPECTGQGRDEIYYFEFKSKQLPRPSQSKLSSTQLF